MAAKRPPLAVVKPGTRSTKPKPAKTVSRAASEGSRRELLVAMRSRVATAVEDPNTPARDLAALTRRLMEIAKDIEAIDAAEAEESRGREATPDEEWDSSAI
jgi:hypothetical protein